jgi:hypothetical protein
MADHEDLTDEMLAAARPRLLRRRARMFLGGLIVSLGFEVVGTFSVQAGHRVWAVAFQCLGFLIVTVPLLIVGAKPAAKVGRKGFSLEERQKIIAANQLPGHTIGGPRRLWLLPSGGIFFAVYIWATAGPEAMAVFASLISGFFATFSIIFLYWRRIFGPYANDRLVIGSWVFHPEDPVFSMPPGRGGHSKVVRQLARKWNRRR